jgi:hypothetical protein
VPALLRWLEQKGKHGASDNLSLVAKFVRSGFLLLDNVNIILYYLGFRGISYKVLKILAYSFRLAELALDITAISVNLRKSFAQEAGLRNDITTGLSAEQLFIQLDEFDRERQEYMRRLLANLGDLVHCVQRANLMELVFSTKVNKGSVGFFGVMSTGARLWEVLN